MASLLQPLPQGKITREEVNRLLETGYFVGQRFELIDGELINKMGQGPRHANSIHLLMVFLSRAFGIERLLVQAPIEAGPKDQKWSQPEPDLAVLAHKGRFPSRHPEGTELALAVEVADSSLRRDSVRKRDMYAHAGVPEYWVLDLDGRQLLVFRGLQGEAYGEQLTLGEADTVPHIGKTVADLL
jgi:Uma2 family endonuclease